jgi:lipoate-protein ligase A
VEGTAQRKVPGGKLVRIWLEHDGSVVTAAEISGDFFVHPEVALYALEGALIGLSLNTCESELSSMIERLLMGQGITVLGFSPDDLAALVRGAMS